MARIAPRKMRWVVDVIRGRAYNSALSILRGMPQRGASYGIKLLKSVFANASQKIREQHLDIDPEALHLVEARVDGGPVFWGMRPSSMRRPQWIRRRTSHVTFILQERAAEEPEPERRESRKDAKVSAQAAGEPKKKQKTEKKSAAATAKPGKGKAAPKTKRAVAAAKPKPRTNRKTKRGKKKEK